METITEFLIDWGYWGLFLSALIAGSVLPFSSEAVMVVLAGMGLDPVGCVVAAALGNTLGGMTCYWIGTLGKTEWITRLGVSTRQLARARKFLSGRGALMAFFAFLPTIGEAIAIVLGLMRSNVWLTGGAMLAGKTLRYIVVLATFRGAKPKPLRGNCCCWPTRSKPRWPTTSAAERATPPATTAGSSDSTC